MIPETPSISAMIRTFMVVMLWKLRRICTGRLYKTIFGTHEQLENACGGGGVGERASHDGVQDGQGAQRRTVPAGGTAGCAARVSRCVGGDRGQHRLADQAGLI